MFLDDPFAVKQSLRFKRGDTYWRFTGLYWKYIQHSSCQSTSDKLSPSLSNMVAVYRSPWQISPTQTGTILKPTDYEMCRIHLQYKDLPAVDNFCAQLPFALVGNRMWNLPESKRYLIHSSRVPGIGDTDRNIEGVDAYWSICGGYPVIDELGTLVGMSRLYHLVFGEFVEDGGSIFRAAGMWEAQEFTCLEKQDGDCSLVALYCKNDRLNSLQVQVGITEYDMSGRLHKNLKLNEKKKEENQPLIDNFKDLDGYLEILATCFAQMHLERVFCSQREERMGRGFFNVEGVTSAVVGGLVDVDNLPEHQRNRSKLLGGSGRYFLIFHFFFN